MRIRRRTLVLLLFVIVVGWVSQRFLFQERRIAVDVAVASRGTVEEVVTNSEAGTVKARHRATLGVERAGRVAVIARREGARAAAGDLLLRLDAATEQRQLDAARRDADSYRAALDAARATAVLAQQNYERIEALRDQNLASPEQLDEARSRRDATAAEERATEAHVESARAAVALAEDALTHIEIRAPFDGVVSQRMVEVGESVLPGQPLLELVGDHDLYVSAPIDERDAGRLRSGLPARITVDTYPGVVWQGEVTRVAPVVDEVREQSRTLEIEAALPHDPSKPSVRPGMTADVEVILDRHPDVLRIPTFAVTEGKRILAVVKDRAVEREVETGVRNWVWTEIRSGLEAGDRVITSLDRPGLQAGARVAPKVEPAASP